MWHYVKPVDAMLTQSNVRRTCDHLGVWMCGCVKYVKMCGVCKVRAQHMIFLNLVVLFQNSRCSQMADAVKACLDTVRQKSGLTDEDRSKLRRRMLVSSGVGLVGAMTFGAAHATFKGYGVLRGMGKFGLGGMMVASMYTG